jgi:hypothetical protein
VQGNILSSEGFARLPERTVAVKMPTALEAVGLLEGRWITPDPIAAIIAAPPEKPAQEVATALAALPRRAEPVVTASDIATAMMEKMKPAPRYRVRWIVKESGRPRPQ